MELKVNHVETKLEDISINPLGLDPKSLKDKTINILRDNIHIIFGNLFQGASEDENDLYRDQMTFCLQTTTKAIEELIDSGINVLAMKSIVGATSLIAPKKFIEGFEVRLAYLQAKARRLNIHSSKDLVAELKQELKNPCDILAVYLPIVPTDFFSCGSAKRDSFCSVYDVVSIPPMSVNIYDVTMII